MQKIIHYFYDDVNIWKKGTAHSVFRICYASWLRHCPDYEFKLWHPKMPEFKKMLKDSRFLRECYKRKIWAFVADYVRYYALYHDGGIYLDTDVQLLSNFDNYLKEPFFISIEGDILEGKNVLEPAVMGGEKGHRLFKDILDIYNSDDIFKMDYFIANVVISKYLEDKIGFRMIKYPKRLQEKATKFYADYNHRKNTDFELYGNQQIVQNDDLKVAIYPSEYFCPTWEAFGGEAFTKNTVAIHWNQSSWWKNGGQQIKELETFRYNEPYKRWWYTLVPKIANLLTCMIPNKTTRRKLRKKIKNKLVFKA